MNNAERIERLERLIEEDVEILSFVHDLGVFCSVRSMKLSNLINRKGGNARDCLTYMVYETAERDLHDLEMVVKREKEAAERKLAELKEAGK